MTILTKFSLYPINNSVSSKSDKNRYPDNCPLRKISSLLGLEFGSRLGLVLGFFSGAIVLEPSESYKCALKSKVNILLLNRRKILVKT